MTIGLLLPSILMTQRFSDRIFAPKPLYVDLADGLSDRGHRVFTYTAGEIKTRAELVTFPSVLSEKNLPSVKVRSGNPEVAEALLFKITAKEFSLDLTSRAFEHARRYGVEVMHSYHNFSSHYASRIYPELPAVYTLHDPLYGAELFEGWRLRQFADDRYIAISESQKRIYQDAGIRVTDTVHHGVSAGRFPYGSSPKKELAFLARLVPEKGAEDAIEAAVRSDILLQIATSDNYMHTAYAKELYHTRIQGNSRVKLFGFADEAGRNEWLKDSLALLFPIHWEEPFGMVMVEAMACGTPVIAYNRGSVPEIVRDGVTGFIIDENDDNRFGKGDWIIKKQGVEGLTEAISRLGEIDRAACRAHVEQNFTVAGMAEGYEKVYHSTRRVE